jgi:hypothetical protein
MSFSAKRCALSETELLKPVSDLLHRGSAPGLAGLNPPAPQVYP